MVGKKSMVILAVSLILNEMVSSKTVHTPLASGSISAKDRVRRQAPPLITPSQCSFGQSSALVQCGWNATRSGAGVTEGSSIVWQLSSGRSAYFRGGPAADASGDDDGGYMLLETSQGSESASIVGPLMNASRPEGRCVVFQYAMDGPSAEKLRLMLKEPPTVLQLGNQSVVALLAPTRREILWESHGGDAGDQWRTAAVLYSHGQPHELVFEAVVEDMSQRRLRGHIALDNVDLGTWRDRTDDEALPQVDAADQQERRQQNEALTSNPCLGHCNFDGGFCGWTNDPDDDFDWKLGRGSVNGATGPSRDHHNVAAGTPSRGYAYIDSGYPRRPGDRARLLSPPLEATNPNQPLCLHFYTHMFGNGVGSLRVSIVSSGTGSPVSREIWSLTGEAGNTWHQGQISVASPTQFRVAFEAVTGRNHLGDIAIDDLSFTTGPCSSAPQAAAHHQGDCNFEADECGWSNVGSRDLADDIDWMRVTAESGRQPPYKDHTSFTGKGYVMTPARGSVQRPGDRAWFVSKPFNVTPGRMDVRCITFWYFMNEPIIDPAGPSLGSLRIYVRNDQPPAQHTAIWRLQNHQGGIWRLARAQIQQSSNYRVVIEGMWGSSRASGSIAIDDVSFYEGTCTQRPIEALPMPAECTFDRDMCNWRNSNDNGTASGRPDVNWRMATVSRRPANLPDHTFGAPSGYVYFDIFSQQNRQEVVRLMGPNMSTAGDFRLCLTFWFSAFGAGETTQLKILVSGNSAGADREIWMLRVGQLDRTDWHFGQVELEGNGTESSHIIFEGRASNGGFAVDDIVIYPGDCRIRPNIAVPGKSRDASPEPASN